MLIGFTVANAHNGFDSKEVYDELEEKLNGVEVKSFKATSDSSLGGACIDYSVWVPVALSVADSLFSIASNIYDVYTLKILPHENKNKNVGLFISIGPENGINFMLGNEYKDKNMFIKDFKLKVISQTETRRNGTIKTTSEISLDAKSK